MCKHLFGLLKVYWTLVHPVYEDLLTHNIPIKLPETNPIHIYIYLFSLWLELLVTLPIGLMRDSPSDSSSLSWLVIPRPVCLTELGSLTSLRDWFWSVLEDLERIEALNGLLTVPFPIVISARLPTRGFASLEICSKLQVCQWRLWSCINQG